MSYGTDQYKQVAALDDRIHAARCICCAHVEEEDRPLSYGEIVSVVCIGVALTGGFVGVIIAGVRFFMAGSVA